MNLRSTLLGPCLALTLTPMLLAACGDDAPVNAGPAGSGGAAAGSGGAGVGGMGVGGMGVGGAGGSSPPGAPITAPNETWTWVPIDGALCADGSPTGIGVNLTDKSKDVIIYMEGGGACWNLVTCVLAKTAANLDGYGEAKFTSQFKGGAGAGLFDRTDATNPTKDYNYVYVPYCTGDVHAGSAEQMYNGSQVTHHVGFTNMTEYLKRIVPTFAGAQRVIISGISAGGFGAGLNWWRTQDAFGKTRVDLIDDSGTPLPDPYLPMSQETTWRAAWNLDAAMPPGCAECKTSLSAVLTYYADNYKTQRAALVSYTQDTVISQFYGISTAKFEEGLKAFTPQFEAKAGFRYFYVAGAGHVLSGDLGIQGKSGTTLKDWLTQMITDDPAWSNDNPWP